MSGIEIVKILLLGLIEGITEWLPISSSGHILLFNEFFPLRQSQEFLRLFLYFIQLGGILAVPFFFFKTLCPFKREDGRWKSDKQTWILWSKVIFACIPAALVGFFFDMPDDPWVIASTLIIYGVAFLVIERKRPRRLTDDVHDVTFRQAALIGIAQTLAVIPGTSRSGVTILAALLLGISRPAGAEFTFFLAIPVMFGASLLQIIRFGFGLTTYEIIYLFIGFFTAFFCSLLCIKFLMSFVKRHTFIPFGWYRIFLGFLVLSALVIPNFT